MKKEKRPWGFYQILLEEKYCKVKKISVSPGHCLSYQYHKERTEDWIVILGEGRVKLDTEEYGVSPGSKVHIPRMMKHTIENTGKKDQLVFIEVQTGKYFGEDNIVRLDDRYGRS